MGNAEKTRGHKCYTHIQNRYHPCCMQRGSRQRKRLSFFVESEWVNERRTHRHDAEYAEGIPG